jgi:hypothetical protein
MQASTEQQSEYNKLLHLLGEQDTSVMQFLIKLSPDELTTLRQKVQSAIYSEQSSQWKRVAGVAKFMPNFVNAKVAEQALGPVITANISYYIDVRDAVSIMRFLSTPFMAEVAGYMVPEKSKELINKLPMDLMKKLVVYLCQNNKHFVVGSFVEVTELDRVVEIALHLNKESDLIGITKYVKDKSSLAGAYRAFNEQKRYKLIEEAHRSNNLNIVIQMAMFLQLGEVLQMSRLLNEKNPGLLKSMLDEMAALNSDGRYDELIRGMGR